MYKWRIYHEEDDSGLSFKNHCVLILIKWENENGREEKPFELILKMFFGDAIKGGMNDESELNY